MTSLITNMAITYAVTTTGYYMSSKIKYLVFYTIKWKMYNMIFGKKEENNGENGSGEIETEDWVELEK